MARSLDLKHAKKYGFIGSILYLGSIIPYIGWFVYIVGIAFVLRALKILSEIFNDKKPFNYYFIGITIGTIAIFISSILIGIHYGNFNKMAIYTFVLWLLFIISAWLIRKSLIFISKYTKINLFKTTGNVFLIGAFLTMVLIGFLIIVVAVILQILSFRSLPESLNEK